MHFEIASKKRELVASTQLRKQTCISLTKIINETKSKQYLKINIAY
jgi:hypothetical protein